MSAINSPNAKLKANRLVQNSRRVIATIFFVRDMKINRNIIPITKAENGLDKSIVIIASRDQPWLSTFGGKVIPSREKVALISKSYAKNRTE